MNKKSNFISAVFLITAPYANTFFNWLPVFITLLFIVSARFIDIFNVDPYGIIPANHVPLVKGWKLSAVILFINCFCIKIAFLKLATNIHDAFKKCILVWLIYLYAFWCTYLAYYGDASSPLSITLVIMFLMKIFSKNIPYKDIHMRGAKMSNLKQVKRNYEDRISAEKTAFKKLRDKTNA